MDDYYLVEEDGGSDYGNDYSRYCSQLSLDYNYLTTDNDNLVFIHVSTIISDEDEWIQGLMESEERDEPNFDEEMEAERKKRCDPRTMSSSGYVSKKLFSERCISCMKKDDI